MIKVMVILGTRPEAIKLAPVIKALKSQDHFQVQVVATAQHKEMLYQALSLFEIRPDVDLDVMMPKQTLFDLSTAVLNKIGGVLEENKPDLAVVQGDTTTTFIASLAAFYSKIPVGHIEAGLRSNNKHHPFPEEINRVLTSDIADLHFAPTKGARDNLVGQGIESENIYMVGNTIIDSLHLILEQIPEEPKENFILVTAHRRENWGKPIENLCLAIEAIAKQKPETRFVFSVHKNPVVREPVLKILSDNSQVKLIEPQDYKAFIGLLNRCYFVLSDSGGVQEEAPALGKPALVFRETTERPEGVEAGVVKLIGNSKKKIEQEILNLLEDKKAYKEMSKTKELYGDGTSSQQIVKVINDYFS